MWSFNEGYLRPSTLGLGGRSNQSRESCSWYCSTWWFGESWGKRADYREIRNWCHMQVKKKNGCHEIQEEFSWCFAAPSDEFNRRTHPAPQCIKILQLAPFETKIILIKLSCYCIKLLSFLGEKNLLRLKVFLSPWEKYS